VKLPYSFIRFRGFSVLQSLLRLQSLGSLWLASNPSALFFRRTLGLSNSSRAKCDCAFALVISSRALLRHLQRLFLLACRILRCPMSTISHSDNAPRLSFFSLQHFRIQTPFFSLHRLMKRPRFVALNLRSAVLRVWLPSLRF
jgi:hypothetical protein